MCSSDLFDGMMLIDLEVALRADPQIEQGVLGQQLEHVVEKADARLDIGLTGAVQLQLQLDLGLVRLTLDQ